MSKRLRIALVLIGAIGVEGIIMGVFARIDPSTFIGVPGPLGALVAVVAAFLAGPLVGVMTALVGGVLFVSVVTHGGPGSELSPLLWAASAATAGVIAERYRGLSRERDAAHEAERAGRRESERARARLARLQTLTAALSGALSSQDALVAVGRQAVDAVGASGAAIGLADGSGRGVEITFASSHRDEPSTTESVSIDANLSLCEVIRTGGALDLEQEEWSSRFADGQAMYGHLGSRLMVRALSMGGERMGAIGLAFAEGRDLEPADLELLDVVVAQVSLVIQRIRSFESEHQIAATLLDSLLPQKLPSIPGIDLSTRYVAGAAGLEIGGDWYDVVSLPDGSVHAAVGDVTGRGLLAAASMGQVRSAWHALAALEHLPPASLLTALDRFVDDVPGGAFSTIVTVRLEPTSGRMTFACAGHPPPLVISPDGEASYLAGGRSMPLGVPWQGTREEQDAVLSPGSTLLLYTDGLIERRGEPIERGFQRLRDTAAARSDVAVLDDLGEVLSRLIPQRHGDDVAMLFVRTSSTPLRFHRRFTSDPRELAGLRQEMRRWLDAHEVASPVCDDVVLACGEAASNAIEHAYTDSIGEVEVTMETEPDGAVVARILDHGAWRPPGSDPFRGRGIDLMRSLMDSVEVETGDDGTMVSMRRSLAAHPALA